MAVFAWVSKGFPVVPLGWQGEALSYKQRSPRLISCLYLTVDPEDLTSEVS